MIHAEADEGFLGPTGTKNLDMLLSRDQFSNISPMKNPFTDAIDGVSSGHVPKDI